MLSISEALQIVLNNITPPPEEEVPLIEARGRFLARNLKTTEPSPPFDTSAMDGFALRWEDTQNPPVNLKVIGDIPAGVHPNFEVQGGEAAKIMTGAPIPAGANAVVPVENTSGFQGEEVEVRVSLKEGEAIRKEGENIPRGAIALREGTRIRAEEVAILATMGISQVPVRRSPTVGILSTGDELVEIDQPLEAGQIRNSNAYMLRTLVEEMGLQADFIGVCKDTPESTLELIQKGLERDFLIITGGASVGERDYVKETFEKLGVETHFQKINLKPGKPTVFGTLREKIVFGLPGNPVSSLITFLLFARPALKKYLGGERYLEIHKGRLAEGAKQDHRERCLPAIWTGGNPPSVKILPWKGSGDLFILAHANCYAFLPPERVLEEGNEVSFIMR